jgi:3'-phosphoadenosine 5'-phosphosulfate sulfotransferase (PAPS reductase)/FAD synthetase
MRRAGARALGARQPPGRAVLSSSFGAQAAVSLHMITGEAPGMPVILIDTGYLFPETYRFIDELTARLGAQPARVPQRAERRLAGSALRRNAGCRA